MKTFEELEREIFEYVSGVSIFAHGDEKLGRMRELMKYLGDPQNKVKVLHIAGTSGKTSTSYYTAALLRAAGYRVGLTVSPHVVDIRDRAQVDMEPLSKEDYVVKMGEYLELLRSGGQKPSYMEFFMGFVYWLAEKEGLDYAVIEVGLGGMFDSSNVADREDKVCLIADIGYDHMEILGDTLPEIAAQKAGIIQQGNRVFVQDQGEEVLEAFASRAREMGAELTVLEDYEKYEELPGFQSRNLGLARRAVEYVMERDGGILSEDHVREAMKVQVPARAEEFEYKGKKVVVDGAHNPQKLGAFSEHIVRKHAGKKVVLVMSLGVNKGASVEECFAAVRGIGDTMVVTSFRDESVAFLKESLPMEMLEEVAREIFGEVEVVADPMEALRIATEMDCDVIVVTGSFFLLNHVRPILERERRK